MANPKTYHNPINGEYTTILQSAADTDGAYTHFEVCLKPGGSNPLHYHTKFSEEFFAVKGSLGLQEGRVKLHLPPGKSFVVPPRTHHRFYNDSTEDIIFRVKLTPGQPKFEDFLKAMFGMVNDGLTVTKNQIPKNIYHTAIMYTWGDTHFSNPAAKAIAPIFGLFYKRAVAKGIEKSLLEKYCR
ncbi:cupin domain-containing protein [Flavobacterium sp. RHBU_24]|uniref:cupin domain-containing protein n=1 Tax=Flavobacterium sp. RHBU_24 TaxID=3391185 RepID=UPI0039856969